MEYNRLYAFSPAFSFISAYEIGDDNG